MISTLFTHSVWRELPKIVQKNLITFLLTRTYRVIIGTNMSRAFEWFTELMVKPRLLCWANFSWSLCVLTVFSFYCKFSVCLAHTELLAYLAGAKRLNFASILPAVHNIFTQTHCSSAELSDILHVHALIARYMHLILFYILYKTYKQWAAVAHNNTWGVVKTSKDDKSKTMEVLKVCRSWKLFLFFLQTSSSCILSLLYFLICFSSLSFVLVPYSRHIFTQSHALYDMEC